MEYLDIVTEDGTPTGKITDRETAHAQGIRHRTAHLWLLRRREGQVQILLQKRSMEKDSNPGCYDISSAGHIPAGWNYIPSCIRELREELGLSVSARDLIYCGQRRFYYQNTFHGKTFLDHQVSNIYCVWMDVEPEDMTLQSDEVESVCWMELKACMDAVRENRIPHCIRAEELAMVANCIGEDFE